MEQKPHPRRPHPGRPQVMDRGHRVNVYLDADSVARAKKIGDGNISEGIRRALSDLKS